MKRNKKIAIKSKSLYMICFMIDEDRRFGSRGYGRIGHKVGLKQRLFPDKDVFAIKSSLV